ncbi:uncharacterized protein ACN427_005071 [Glossina fuscipes fuscipes]
MKPAALKLAGNISAYDPFRGTIIPSKSTRGQQQQLFRPSLNQRSQKLFCCEQEPTSVDIYRQLQFRSNTGSQQQAVADFLSVFRNSKREIRGKSDNLACSIVTVWG